MPNVKPISELQRNMAEITRECSETKQPIYLTKNGSAALVVMDAEAFDKEMNLHNAVYERESRVFNAIMRGIEDVREGRTRSLRKAVKDARAKRNAQHA